MRPEKDIYYLKIAEAVAQRSTCLRRRYGAVIVRDDEIVSTGYNGAPRGEVNCCDAGFCKREAMGIPKGERYELCSSIHAEQNAIISAARRDKYYLGGGMRNPKWLWALEESSHISLMRQLFRYLRDLGEAPEWIDEDEIEGYALAMGVAA